MEPDLELLLGPGGVLAERAVAYEDRPMQREMARLVHRAIEESHHLTIEAGTGTGKTLAYLIPAILSGRRVVVSTATRALQEQIFYKDLPFLADQMGLPFKASCLKGRSNYVCLLRKQRFDEQPTFSARDHARHYEKIQRWVTQTTFGDRAELAEVPEDFPVWQDIVSSPETCIGQRCEFYDDCFIVKLRKDAAESEIVVVNHHLFFADLALRTSEAGIIAGAEVIPRYDVVVFDEAHSIENIATNFFGMSLSNHRLADLAREIGRVAAGNPELSRSLEEAASRLERRSAAFFGALQLPSGRERMAPRAFDRAQEELESLQEALDVTASVAALGAEMDDDVAALERRARELEEALGALVVEEPAGWVHWSEVRGNGVYLHASPIDIAETLRDKLLRRVDTCVFTSATLSSDGNLDFFRGRIGLQTSQQDDFEQDAQILPSPFDYERQVALFVPDEMPLPKEAGFPEAVARVASELFGITSGRAFVLCTSRRNMFAIHALLRETCPYPLLLQGEAPKAALLESFRAEPSVLVATQSFWEGVDVPGDALSLVIIDKLPFGSPGDPVMAARLDEMRREGRSPFNELQLPLAALALKQGFGRLIRARTDRGIVAVCDIRLATRGYRGHFIRTLPPCPRFRDLGEIAQWWQSGGDPSTV